ncbi:MAG: Catalase (EC [uncultured Caballeronia sp.]|nr:MAG: Catalase (EC [uncultured Caballeronia sp.]
MSQALNHIAQAVDQIETMSRNASRGVHVALVFGIVATAYGIVVASGVVAA